MLSDFDKLVKDKLGYNLFPYQSHVSERIIKELEEGKSNFIVVSMPTGSGKTVIELFMAYYFLKKGVKNVIVMEPTRLLCDQMYFNFWRKIFGEDVGMEYEGECTAFEEGKKIVVSTPFTAEKCAPETEAIIVDEVHHAFGDSRYESTLVSLDPKYLIGFTALLPSYKKYMVDPRLVEKLGKPKFLNYDFKALAEIDPTFNPPKAIADVFDAEMNKIEDSAYDAFFRGQVKGDKNTLKFLEITLYSYGKEAFCESLGRMEGKIEENPQLDFLCESKELSHKARALRQILSIYKIEDFKPVLIFTSRKATAYEFEKAIEDLDPGRIKVLTGDSSKFERQKLVKSAKRGEIDVIISTLVGEEGIDIPEAKLLIMTDVPQSPLRFYQRLGRLIRSKTDENNNDSENTLKYLVVALTPKTPEYDNLDDALRNLYLEGVDVSYIVEKKEGKGPVARVVDIVKKEGGGTSFSKLDSSVGEISSIEVLLSPKNVETQMGDYVDRAIKEGRIFYYYDVDKMADLASKVLLGSYCNLCFGEKCMKICKDCIREVGKLLISKKGRVKLEKKGLLLHYMELVLPEKMDEIMNAMNKEKDEIMKKVESAFISLSSTKRANVYSIIINFNVSVDGMTIYPKLQLDYYNANEQEIKLAEINAKAIGYKAIYLFLQQLK